MAKIYRVTLTDAERDELSELVSRRSGKSLPVRRGLPHLKFCLLQKRKKEPIVPTGFFPFSFNAFF